MAAGSAGPADFFISYTAADVSWARWIDWQLRAGGHTTLMQFYDFRPGESFLDRMQAALVRCRWTVCLLSDAYFRSRWCTEEWQAALHAQNLVPVRIMPVEPRGLLASRIWIDLDTQDEPTAIERLAAGLALLLDAKTRPADKPTFPSAVSSMEVGSPTRFPRSPPPIWTVPRRRNPYFTGRDDLLARLHARVSAGGPAALTQALAIRGLGGVGKTQLAIEYAHRYAAEYDGVVWLGSEDPAALASDYAGLAQPLGLEELRDQSATVRAVRAELSRRARMLVVFDNAKRPADLAPFLPHGERAHVIVTTRSPAWPGAYTHHLDVLPEGDAVAFLRKRIGRTEMASDDATRIVRLLGCLPLALEQAAAYVTARAKSLAEYAALLEQHGLRALERGEPHDYEKTVGTVWQVAMERLSDCPGAAELFNLCAFMAPDAVHLADLQTASARLADEGHGLHPGLAAVVANELLLDDAKEAVLRYSLAIAEGDAITIHRLVQQVVRDRMTESERRSWLAAALRSMRVLFSYDADEVGNWPLCAQLLPHAQAVVNRDGAAQVDVASTLTLLNQMAGYLLIRGHLPEAEALFRRALDIDETERPGHPDVGTRYNNLALLFLEMDRPGEAEPLLQRAIAIGEAALGPDHDVVAVRLTNLALALRDLGRAAEAEPLLRRALVIGERTLGPSHQYLLGRRAILATVLGSTDRMAEAETMLRGVVETGEATFGPDHPNVGRYLAFLARLFQKQGRLVEARPLARRALQIFESQLGPTHPTTAELRAGFSPLIEETPTG